MGTLLESLHCHENQHSRREICKRKERDRAQTCLICPILRGWNNVTSLRMSFPLWHWEFHYKVLVMEFSFGFITVFKFTFRLVPHFWTYCPTSAAKKNPECLVVFKSCLSDGLTTMNLSLNPHAYIFRHTFTTVYRHHSWRRPWNCDYGR